MKEVKTSSHYGIPILIDQCPKCGGLWFDEDELYRTRHGSAKDIESEVDRKKLTEASTESTAFKNRKIFCPRDSLELKAPKEKYFSQLEILVCPKCKGFWLNAGGFVSFQSMRQKRMKVYQSRSTAENRKKSLSEADEKMQKQIIAIMKLYSSLERDLRKEKDRNMAATSIYTIWMLLKLLFFKKL